MSSSAETDIQFASDFHLEGFRSYPGLAHFVQPTAQVLVLAGDLVDPFHDWYACIVSDAARAFERVIVVLGNREHYGNSLHATKLQARKVIETHGAGRVTLLENETVRWKDITFFGATLWSHVPEDRASVVASRLSSYTVIRQDRTGDPITVRHTNAIFRESVVALYDAAIKAKAAGRKLVVVSHHLPSFRCMHQRWRSSAIGAGWASNLDHVLDSGLVALWIHGHTHDSQNMLLPSGSRVVCNPAGFAGHDANTTYDATAVATV